MDKKTFPIILGKPVPKDFVENKKKILYFNVLRHNDGP